MVDIVLGNSESHLVGELSPYAIERIRSRLCFQKMGCEHIEKYQEGEWDGMVHLFEIGKPFMTGLLRPLCLALQESSHEFRIIDRRNRTFNNFPELEFHKPSWYEEREYQDFTVQKSMDVTRGILNIGTGGGKTVIVSQLIGSLKVKPFMFYVLTKDLLYQAKETLQACLNCEIGQIGDGIVDIKDINVCTKDAVVYAIHKKDSSFDANKYKFDSCDIWSESDLFGDSDSEKIVDLVRNCRGVYFDECISGESEVITETGKEKLSEAVKNKRRFVMTHDGNSIIMSPILNWWSHGRKKVIKIKIDDGRNIICTENHLIFTERGWIQAGNLTPKDHLFCASVDAGPSLTEVKGKEIKNTFSGIKSREDLISIGKSRSKDISKILHIVNADVENGLSHVMRPFISFLGLKEEEHIRPIFMATTNNQYGQNIILLPLQKKNKRLSGPALATRLFFCLIKGQKTFGSSQIMGFARENGQNINLLSCQDLEQKLSFVPIQASEIYGQEYNLNACRRFLIFQKNFIQMGVRPSHLPCSINSEMSGLLGGFVMTEAFRIAQFSYILKAIQKWKMRLSPLGLEAKDIKLQSTKLKRNTFSSRFSQSHQERYREEYQNLCQNVCDTNWHQIEDIVPFGEEDVYDIEVKDTHSFFANGVLVHNCHHASSSTIKDVMMASKNAYWRYGGTATYAREDGEELVIQGLFGKKIVDISLSYLIKHNWLVPATVFFAPVVFNNMPYRSYPQIYSSCVVNNEEVNRSVAENAMYLESLGKSSLILVSKIAHGKNIQALIPGSIFLTGKDTSKKRNSAIEMMRKGKKKILIATTLADEGLDIKNLDVVHMVGAGASVTRVPQRIGRVVRKCLGKKYGIAIYYHYCVNYLYQQGLKAKRIIRQEPRISIRQTCDLKDLRDQLVKFMNENTSLFS